MTDITDLTEPIQVGEADPDESRAPIIGITARRYEAGDKFKLEAAVALPSDYADAVNRAGGFAVLLPSVDYDPAAADAAIAHLDGLVLTGGPDVDPARYGQVDGGKNFGVSPLQDSFEEALLHAALRSATPVLAICRGLQLVNVAFGGTLHQHITGEPHFGAHGIPNGGGGTPNTFDVEPGSLLATVLGATSFSGRCHHHQAVDAVGDDLVVTARTPDGVVEGLELADATGSWLVAVQCHPEETSDDDPATQALFDHLIAAARH